VKKVRNRMKAARSTGEEELRVVRERSRRDGEG
jgi:hypothetical protein